MLGLSIIVSGSWILMITLAVVYFCSNSAFNALYPYTSEIFETEIRSLSNGFFNLVSRTGGAFSPTILLIMNDVSPIIPYMILTCVSALAFGIAMKLPVDTRRANLDTVLGIHDDTSNRYEQRSNRSYNSVAGSGVAFISDLQKGREELNSTKSQ